MKGGKKVGKNHFAFKKKNGRKSGRKGNEKVLYYFNVLLLYIYIF